MKKKYLCKICKKIEIESSGRWAYCEDCKKTEEYKKMIKEINEKIFKDNGKLIQKKCRSCKKLHLTKKYDTINFCEECTKNGLKKQYTNE